MSPDPQPNYRLQVLAGEYFQNFYKMAEKSIFMKNVSAGLCTAFLDSAESFTSCPAFAGMTKKG
jgi:hypothetical protein